LNCEKYFPLTAPLNASGKCVPIQKPVADKRGESLEGAATQPIRLIGGVAPELNDSVYITCPDNVP
jgi:hypothetical protein